MAATSRRKLRTHPPAQGMTADRDDERGRQKIQPGLSVRRGNRSVILRAYVRIRIHRRDAARLPGKLESASNRHRPPRKRKDKPPASHSGRDTSRRLVVIAFLSRRVRGRKLRGLHRGRILAGMPVLSGGAGSGQGRRPRPRPQLRGTPGHFRRPDARRALPLARFWISRIARPSGSSCSSRI